MRSLFPVILDFGYPPSGGHSDSVAGGCSIESGGVSAASGGYRWALPLIGVGALLLWVVGEYLVQDWLALPWNDSAALVFVLEVGLMLSLPISGLMSFHRLAGRTSQSQTPEKTPKSRPTRNGASS